jgi:hypothetical protein
MSCEVTVKIKEGKRTLTQKATVMGDIKAAYDDPEIDRLVSNLNKMFGGTEGLKKTAVTIKLVDD